MELFGKLGYKKTSVNDIAKSVNISKAMIFKYFQNKKQLYLYLIDFASNLIVTSINEGYDATTTDFFDRIEIATSQKLKVLKQYPAIVTFLTSIHFETDKEIIDDLKIIFENFGDIRSDLVLHDVDYLKFKENINPDVVLNMLSRIGEGYVNNTNTPLDIDKITEEFSNYLKIMKENFYKKEYL